MPYFMINQCSAIITSNNFSIVVNLRDCSQDYVIVIKTWHDASTQQLRPHHSRHCSHSCLLINISVTPFSNHIYRRNLLETLTLERATYDSGQQKRHNNRNFVTFVTFHNKTWSTDKQANRHQIVYPLLFNNATDSWTIIQSLLQFYNRSTVCTHVKQTFSMSLSFCTK